MVVAILLALGVRIKSPAPRERSVESLAALLGEAVGGVVQSHELVWENSRSFASELLFGRHILFLASSVPGGPRDVYRARVRLTFDGSPLDVTQVRNLTETPRGDDVALELNGSRAVFATLAFGRIQGISVIETLGVRDGDRPPGLVARLLFALTSFQRTGSFQGVGRTDIVLDLPARMAHLTLDAGRLAVDFGERGRALVYDLERRSLRGADGGEAYAARALPQVHGAKPLVFWAVDSVRAELGPEPVAWLERVVFGARDSMRRTTYALFQGDAGARLRSDAEQRAARVLEPSELGGGDTWPPPKVPSLWKEPKPGEGEWVPVTHDFLKTMSAAAAGTEAPAPYFFRTSIRPDPERPYSEVLLIAMDMRQLELGMQAGYEDPKPTTGPPGEGRLPRDPAIYRRVVATFNGAFKTTHGEYGMMVNRRVLLPPVPGGASLVVDEEGGVGLGSWPQSDEIPESLVSFRQNLDPLVEDGVPNPTGRQLWGWQLEGKSVMTERTAVCVTPAGHLYYAWGSEIDGATLGKALRQAGCSYAMHLDMNPGHCGFVFSDIKDPRSGAMTLKVAHDGMKVNPEKYARWSAKDFFYVMLRNPTPPAPPGLEWSSDGGLQPPPAWLPGIFTAKQRIGELGVELVSIERGRVDYRLHRGALERLPAAAPPLPEVDSRRVFGAIGLGHATELSRYGLVQGKSDQSLPLDSRYATLVFEDGAAPRLLAPREMPNLTATAQAVQLPLLAWSRKLVDRASDRGALRPRGALCVTGAGRVLVAEAQHDSSGPLAQALLDAGCDAVVELDRGSHHPSFVHRTGTATPPMSHYEGTVLYLLGRPMLPHAFRWKPEGAVPSTKVTSFDVPAPAPRRSAASN